MTLDLGNPLLPFSTFAAFPQIKPLRPLLETGELDTWQPGTDCCFWVGVTCDKSRRVTGLDLSNRSIAGTIDPILFNLTSLQTLNLSYNEFYHRSILDSGWERLANLSSLNLSSSKFTGKVPAGISRLTKLTFLDLSNNDDLFFTANPIFMQNMSNLRELHLDYVNLSAYGGEWCGALANSTPELEVLSMQGCSLFGYFPSKIFLLRNLKDLQISYNQMLSGSLPDFPEDSNLEKLNLFATNFYGNLPDTIGNLKFLTYMDLGGCQFSGRIPPSMGNLSQLKWLSLSDNKFSGSVIFLLPFSMISEPPHNCLSSLNTHICLNDKLCDLEYLDLSYNDISGPVPATVFTLPTLRYLLLRQNQFSGQLAEFTNASSMLTYVDLSNNKLQGQGQIPKGQIPMSFFKISRLYSLEFASNNFSGVVGSEFIKDLTDLAWLSLSNNKLTEIPTFFCNLTSLEALDLSNNKLNGSIPPCLVESSNLKSLRYLDLSKNKLTGEIPRFCNLTNLEMLDLSDNKLTGLIPLSLFKEGCGLRMLNLRGNQLLGAIPHEVTPNCKLQIINLGDNQLEGLLPRFLSNCRSLELLDLGNNNLKDVFPYWLGNISTLSVLILRSNKFYGLVGFLDGSQKTNYNFSTVNVLDISSNNFSGNLCERFFNNFKLMMINTTNTIKPVALTSLDVHYPVVVPTIMDKWQIMMLQKFWKTIKLVDISNNSFEGEIPISIGQLVSLEVLNLSRNHFTGKILPQLGNLTQLKSLDLSMNNLSGKIPAFICNMANLVMLSLSHNKLTGSILPCLLERGSLVTLASLNYANNNLTGEIPTFICNFTYLQTLDLSNNKLNGSIPPCLLERISLNYVGYLDLSKNKLTGEIPTFNCNLTNLEMLDLSDNKLTGSIPSCLFEEGCGLRMLNLRENQLHGAIPHGVTPNCKLQIINLRDNQLEGLLPRFLSNCRSLELLDLGNNNLKDVFPYWLANISTLRVLILRSNMFYGLIGPLDGNQKTNYTFPALNVLDISSNNFSGNISAICFSTFKSMMINTTDVIKSSASKLSGVYYSLVVLTIMEKGQIMTIQNFWTIIKSIDISNNNFEGDVPISIGQLVSLQVLNLSQNHLIGRVLPQLGNLLQLESLDLSMNSLSGQIPQELVSLHFLSFLNLSFNKLVGEIPSGGQFSTFQSTSFEGNKGLCWHPCNTSVPAVNNKAPSAPSLGGTTSENKSYKIVLGLLFGVGLGGSMAVVIVFDVMCCDRSMRRRSIRPTHG
ncbi:receptor-like protein 12 [Phalaenopsis equestris]|uniref:receptor-like protein 12 n=1 Tax=Phalaenopsis equestris TaxID=78828 RepID=UPI0009E2A7CE|nr:receptor-like protein 12 [Phalaenopsis equestris]